MSSSYPGYDVICRFICQQLDTKDPLRFLMQHFNRHTELENGNYHKLIDKEELTKKYFEQQIQPSEVNVSIIASLMDQPSAEDQDIIDELEKELNSLNVQNTSSSSEPTKEATTTVVVPDLFSRVAKDVTAVRTGTASKKKKKKKKNNQMYKDGQVLDLGLVNVGGKMGPTPYKDGQLLELGPMKVKSNKKPSYRDGELLSLGPVKVRDKKQVYRDGQVLDLGPTASVVGGRMRPYKDGQLLDLGPMRAKSSKPSYRDGQLLDLGPAVNVGGRMQPYKDGQVLELGPMRRSTKSTVPHYRDGQLIVLPGINSNGYTFNPHRDVEFGAHLKPKVKYSVGRVKSQLLFELAQVKSELLESQGGTHTSVKSANKKKNQLSHIRKAEQVLSIPIELYQ